MKLLYEKKMLSILVFFFFISSLTAFAQLNLPLIFRSGAVLQRDHVIPIWGIAYPDSNVTVTFDGVELSGQADAQGKWEIEFPSKDAGGPFTMIINSGVQTINLTNIYVGDVWLAAGQSNIELAVSQADSAASVIASANDQKIRQFKIPKGLANEPSDDLPAGSAWTPATSSYVGNFTAVGYFFARELRKHYDVPIGIINASYGGARIEAYMSDAMLGYDESDTVLAAGEPERQPTLIFNKMIYPLLQYPIKGVIWYQGESNADNMDDALRYSGLFKTQIQAWRALWNEGDFPFLWVQLPNYGEVQEQPSTWDAWPKLRAGQSEALSIPNTGEAVTIDAGGVDIHPTHKQPVGYRLSLLARKVAYGEDIVFSGPRYKSNLLREDGKIEINYNYIGSGLIAKGSDSVVTGFAVAGEDERLYWADAVIKDDHVLVWNDTVPDPVLVRYAWEYNPGNVNLYNAEDLPAAPFLAYVNPGFKISFFKSARTAIEYGQSTTLTWLVFGASSIKLDGADVDSAGSQIVSPLSDTSYTLIAVNREDPLDADTAVVNIIVLDPGQINRAAHRPVSASSYETCCGEPRVPEYAVDDSMQTRWSSAWNEGSGTTPRDSLLDDDPDDEWFIVDMGESIDINRVILSWEAAYGSEYDVEVSYDRFIWRNVYQERAGNGGEDNISFSTPVSGKYIRFHFLKRGTQYGYSLYEIAVYGLLSALKPPSIEINTNTGNVFSPGANVTLTAAAADADGTIQRVVFYVDGIEIGTDTESPFEAAWTTTDSSQYNIYGVAVDNDTISVQSEPFYIYKDEPSITKFEAEDGDWSGAGPMNVLNSSQASGGKYLELRDAWRLYFNNVGIDEAGEYLLIFAYQLTFESPKNQYLVVNGDTAAYLKFTAPNKTAWFKKGLKINLKSGINEIAVYGEWNWMSFDYLGIPNATIVSVEQADNLPGDFRLFQNYPNPFNPSTIIKYNLPKQTHVILKIYDILGREIRTLVDREQKAGSYNIEFKAANLASGVYFYKLQADDFSQNKKMLLLK